MSKLQLPQCTLICLTNKDFEGHKKAIDKSCEEINFGAVKLIWDEKCTSIDEWNRRIIQDLWKYVDTSHAMLIHADGYIIHPEKWDEKWLEYDYIGAPWPLPTDDYSYRSESGKIQRVGNSVSLRSLKLMHLASTRKWKSYYGNTNEDGFICCHNREWLEDKGCKFAPFEEARFFSKENTVYGNTLIDEPFAFHSI